MFFIGMFLLLVILMALGVISIFGDTNLTTWKSVKWGILATTLGSIWTWILIAWGNFVLFIWIPAWETIMAQRPIDVYEIGAVILVFGLIVYLLSMLRTAIISWTRDGIIRTAS